MGALLVRAVLGSAGVRIFGMLFGFGVGILLARCLGAEGYGTYGLAMSILVLLTAPTECGLPQLITREMSAAQISLDRATQRGILLWSSRASMSIAFAVAAALVTWLTLIEHDLDSPLSMALLTGLPLVPLVALSNQRAAALRGLEHLVKGQVPDVLVRPLAYVFLLGGSQLIDYRLDVQSAMALGVASVAMALLAAEIMLRRHLPSETRDALPLMQSRRWWSSALPMSLTQGMRLLQNHLVVLLLGALVTRPEVGQFRVASSLILLIAFPVSLLNVVVAPIITRLHAGNQRIQLQRLLSWSALAMVLGTALVALPFLVGGSELLALIFGDEFVGAEKPTTVLCVSAVANGFFGANSVLLNMVGRQKYVTKASTIALCVLIVVAPALIVSHGVVGAAYASALSTLIWNVRLWRDASRLLALDTSFLYLCKRGLGDQDPKTEPDCAILKISSEAFRNHE